MKLKDLKNKKLGITFLGGGMRCAAYLGMLKALEEKGIKPYSLIGSSGGAVVAASYAFGHSTDEILNHFAKLNLYKAFNPLNMLKKRGIDYAQWANHASKLVDSTMDINQSAIKLSVRVVDLEKNDSVYISEGNALEAVIASCALINSYEFDGHKYIDGAYDPETGVLYHSSVGAEVTALCFTHTKKPSMISHFNILQENALRTEIKLHSPDLVVEVPIISGSLFSRKHLREYYDSGYSTMKEVLDRLE